MLYSILRSSFPSTIVPWSHFVDAVLGLWCVCNLLDSRIIGFPSVYRFSSPSLNDSARIRVLSCCLGQIPNQSTYVRLVSRVQVFYYSFRVAYGMAPACYSFLTAALPHSNLSPGTWLCGAGSSP
jgi:hypothetical protein